MRSTDRAPGAAFAMAAVVDGALCAALGGLLGGLRGSQLGLVAGLALAALPVVVRFVASWLSRPDTIVRFVARQVVAVVLALAHGLADRVGALLSPVAAAARGPVLVLRFVAFVVVGGLQAALASLGRTLATPLGVANLVALTIVALDVAGSGSTVVAAVAGLAMLVIVLLVDQHETREGDGKTSG